MTDAEVICEFMEPRPTKRPNEYALGQCHRDWWAGTITERWAPVFEVCDPIEYLGRLHEVEAQLTEEQWLDYKCALLEGVPHSTWHMASFKASVHALADQKIRALAELIRAGKEQG
ncbi:MAG: hypothetical protein LLG20_18370 [Acidobacteriales bacterium]|nr:hypothetical protein [Terriglobales bacterium]